jgi:hypothetical protein
MVMDEETIVRGEPVQKRAPFVILTPQYFRDYRQEYYVLNWQKEQLYLKFILAGTILLLWGMWL